MSNRPVADFIMVSDFARTSGGRETWAYGFLPHLLMSRPSLTLRVHGMRREDQPDNGGLLLEAAGDPAKGRMIPVFHDVKRGRLPLFVGMLRRLRAWMKRDAAEAPDWVVAAGCVNEQILLLATPRLRRSFRIVWLRTILLDQRTERIPRWLMPLARRIDAWLIGRANLIIANGQDIADYYAKYDLRVEIIRNGIDAARWLMPPPDLAKPLRVALIGRLIPMKGVAEVLAAAEILKQSADVDRFEFHIVGDGQLEADVRAAHESGLIHYHGPVANDALPALLETFHACVAFTFVSDEKGGAGTSNALMEQMAAGRAVIAWDNVIYRQMLDESRAWLVPQGDVAAVVQALRDIAAKPDETHARIAAGRRHIDQFSLDVQTEKFLALLRKHGLSS